MNLSKGVWVAGAFKGASGEKQYIPDIKSHVQNQLSWLQIMERESQQVEFFENIHKMTALYF